MGGHEGHEFVQAPDVIDVSSDDSSDAECLVVAKGVTLPFVHVRATGGFVDEILMVLCTT